ncbi:MAG TPA: hypothetical protein DCL35_03800 [Candidatus Omnitrophica bacterium]|nr:hypothetical protein [Candidatus Omnitrophota bacterium]
MNRFFVEKKYIGDTTIEISDAADVRHLARVLRIPQGEAVFISDGQGTGYVAQVSRISKNSVVLKIIERQLSVERKAVISLACAIPKNARFEDIVDKCTQLGVGSIAPLVTERTLVSKTVFNKKLDRLNRVMIAAAKQSGVLFLPEIKEAVGFLEFLPQAAGFDLALLPNLSEKSMTIKKSLEGFSGKRVLVMIGPEGDFTPGEISLALEAGCRGISLGESVLRVDTAAICAVSFLRLYLGL